MYNILFGPFKTLRNKKIIIFLSLFYIYLCLDRLAEKLVSTINQKLYALRKKDFFRKKKLTRNWSNNLQENVKGLIKRIWFEVSVDAVPQLKEKQREKQRGGR